MGVERAIRDLERNAKLLSKLKNGINTILANDVYNLRECERQVKKLKNAGANKEEIDLVIEAWETRKILVERCKVILKEIIKEVNNGKR